MAVLDAGAEEVNDLGEAYEVVSEPTDLVAVRTALQDAGIDYESAESSFVPSVTVPLDEDGARKIFRLIDAIEDCDDVQNVYANFDVSDDIMAAHRRLTSGAWAVRVTGSRCLIGRAYRRGWSIPAARSGSIEDLPQRRRHWAVAKDASRLTIGRARAVVRRGGTTCSLAVTATKKDTVNERAVIHAR